MTQNEPFVVSDEIRSVACDAVGAALAYDAYFCTRTWSAWGCGTMSEADFWPISEDTERLTEIADAALSAAGNAIRAAVPKILVVCDVATTVSWLVRYVPRVGPKEPHSTTESVVEFYDTRYPHTEFGQLVSSYDRETLLSIDDGVGLVLDTASKDWSLGVQAVQRVKNWLKQL